jgi:alpha-galactosidase
MRQMAKTKESKGHIEHTKTADDQKGLPGEFNRPIKVTFLGAGSGFTPHLFSDVLQIPRRQKVEFALVDIDKKRLTVMHQLCRKVAENQGVDPDTVKATTNRREVLRGTDYIINCIEVSGIDCVKFDNEIPLKYGVDQCIGDTMGPGGLFKGLRTIPVWLEILRDAEELCPDAVVLNYTNPMSMLCLAAGRTSTMQIVGLCHSVQGTGHALALRAGVPYEEMEWECAGINHLAWFTKLKHKGKDLYPKLMKQAEEDLKGKWKPAFEGDRPDLVRKHMMLQFGAFITESSGHLSEYIPYYRKRKDLMDKFMNPNYDGESAFYANNWPKWRADGDKVRKEMIAGKRPMKWERTWEYASFIIEAREKDTPYRIHGNVMNRTKNGAGPLIANLPTDGCVEVACMIDRNGINPTSFGALPPQMAGVCDSNMRFFDLAAKAAVEKSMEAAVHALMMDPLTAAVCSLDEIRQMTYDLFKAEKKFLRGYK